MTHKSLTCALLFAVVFGGCAADTGEEPDDQPTVDEVGQVSLDLLSPGASIRTGVGPNIFSKNVTYTLTLPVQGGSGIIDDVRWSWALSYIPSGLVVNVCRANTSSCILASNQSGVTTAWAGLTSNVPFLLTFRVVGTGTMSPAFGKSDQLIINYH